MIVESEQLLVDKKGSVNAKNHRLSSVRGQQQNWKINNVGKDSAENKSNNSTFYTTYLSDNELNEGIEKGSLIKVFTFSLNLYCK